jgi:hypothetical protein
MAKKDCGADFNRCIGGCSPSAPDGGRACLRRCIHTWVNCLLGGVGGPPISRISASDIHLASTLFEKTLRKRVATEKRRKRKNHKK